MKNFVSWGYNLEIESLKKELESTKKIMWNQGKQLDEYEDVLQELVNGIDLWNESIQTIIGKIPNYNWGSLNKAKELLKKK